MFSAPPVSLSTVGGTSAKESPACNSVQVRLAQRTVFFSKGIRNHDGTFKKLFSFYLKALHVSTPWTLPQRLGGTVMPLLAMFACSKHSKYSLNSKKGWSHELLTITQITTTLPKEGSPGGWESQSHCHSELPTEHFFQILSSQVPAKSKTGGGLPWDQIVVGPIAIFQPKNRIG